MSDIAIRIEKLSKKYRIKSAKSSGSFSAYFSNLFNNYSSDEEEFWALQDITFNIKKGEAIGLIGKNGAGKSTLLKILSRITESTSGRIEIEGRISSLLEVGTGFHSELSGRENIFLNGTILGMKRADIRKKLNEIIAFSGIEKFIDTPVKRYSSGMYVRLAFAVAAHLNPEVLIIDEVLAVGDVEFQKKCLGKMSEVAGEGRTVLFVSHNMSAARKLCKTGVYLKDGKLGLHATIDEVINQYLGSGDQDSDYYKNELNYDICNKSIRVNDIKFELKDNEALLDLEFSVDTVMQGIGVMVALYDNNENIVFKTSTNPIWSDQLISLKGNKKVSIHFHEFNLTGGEYYIGVGVTVPGVKFLLKINKAKRIEIPDRNIYNGTMDLAYSGNGYYMIRHEWIL